MNEMTMYWQSLISLMLLVVFLFWIYRDYRIDKFRQNLFALRDEFFEEAARGKLRFDDPAYGVLRSTMNGAIRFAHRFNLSHSLLFLFLARRDKKLIALSYEKRLATILHDLSDEQRRLALNYHMKMNILILEHMVMSSPVLLMTVIIPLVFVLLTRISAARLVSIFKPSLDQIDDLAWVTGRT